LFWFVCFCDEATFHNIGSFNRQTTVITSHQSTLIDLENKCTSIESSRIGRNIKWPNYWITFLERTINEIFLDFLWNYLPDYLEKTLLDVWQRMWLMLARLHIIIVVFEDSSFEDIRIVKSSSIIVLFNTVITKIS